MENCELFKKQDKFVKYLICLGGVMTKSPTVFSEVVVSLDGMNLLY